MYEHEEEINKYYTFNKVKRNASNHKITIANYKGNTYYLDPTNARLYIPSKYEENSLVDSNGLRDTKIVQTSANKKILPQYKNPKQWTAQQCKKRFEEEIGIANNKLQQK